MPRAKRGDDVEGRVFEGSSRLEAENLGNLLGADTIGTWIIRLSRFDRDRLSGGNLTLDNLANNLRNLRNPMILISRVESFAADKLVIDFEQETVEVDKVINVNIRSLLFAAKDGDCAALDRMRGKNVHRQVETLPWRNSADRSRTNGNRRELRGLIAEEDVLAHPLNWL